MGPGIMTSCGDSLKCYKCSWKLLVWASAVFVDPFMSSLSASIIISLLLTTFCYTSLVGIWIQVKYVCVCVLYSLSDS